MLLYILRDSTNLETEQRFYNGVTRRIQVLSELTFFCFQNYRSKRVYACKAGITCDNSWGSRKDFECNFLDSRLSTPRARYRARMSSRSQSLSLFAKTLSSGKPAAHVLKKPSLSDAAFQVLCTNSADEKNAVSINALPAVKTMYSPAFLTSSCPCPSAYRSCCLAAGCQ